MTKNKKLPMCRSREGGDLCWYWYGATSKMDSRLLEKDRVFFVMYIAPRHPERSEGSPRTGTLPNIAIDINRPTQDLMN